jgi:hypothetical protein
MTILKKVIPILFNTSADVTKRFISGTPYHPDTKLTCDNSEHNNTNYLYITLCVGEKHTGPAEGKYSRYLENYTVRNFTFSALRN